MCAAPNASEFFCKAHLAKMNAFYTILTFHFKYEILYNVNSLTWADENQLKCDKVRFLSEMNEINSRWVIFNFLEWIPSKSVYIYICVCVCMYVRVCVYTYYTIYILFYFFYDNLKRVFQQSLKCSKQEIYKISL